MTDLSGLAISTAYPEIFLACAGMVLLMVGAFGGDRMSGRIAAGSVAALAVTAVWVLFGAHGVAFSGQFVADAFTSFGKVLVLLGAAAGILLAGGYNRREEITRFEYPVIALFATLGMMLMISANDLISLYLGLELQSLPLYVLASFRRDTIRSTEAGLKYFVLGALSSGMLLYGASLVYGFAGSTDFDALARVLQPTGPGALPIGVLFGLVFVIAGLAFKVSAAPFHMWTPDVYEGSPTPVTAFFSVAPKIAAVALLVRVLYVPFGHMVAEWQQIVSVLAVVSMVVGGFAAIVQRNIKRLMAYSSISHVGFALVGLAAGTQAGARGVLVYMAIYLFMNLGTFAIILAMRRGGHAVESIDDLAGLSRTHPGLAAALAAFMFSMAGIPPLAGFFGKLYVFVAAIQAGLVAVAVIGVLMSVVSCFYYLRIIKLAYFDEPSDALDRTVDVEVRGVALVSGLVVLLFVLSPMAIVGQAATAAAALFAG